MRHHFIQVLSVNHSVATVAYLINNFLYRSGPVAQFFVSLCLIFLTCIANSQQSDTDGFSVIAPLASRSLLLDGIVKGGKFVVVGERGHILLSGDGYDWRQVEVPTQSTLTGVCFIDGNLGWAVGHDAVILKTTNGGQHWDKVHYEPEAEAPLLDVWFGDEHHGIAIGAYGNYLVSHDGGATWIRSELNVLDEGDPDEGDTEDTPDKDEFTGEYQLHLNAIAQSDAGQLYIVAEAGRIYRSDNSGESWSEMPSPYIGSLFGVLPLSGNTVFVYGLRGHLYRSDDAGLTWQKMETGTMEMLTDGIRLSDGKIVIAGMGGALLVSPDNGASFALIQQSNRTGYAAVMEEDTQNLLMVGDGGINHIKLIGTY